MKKWLRRLVWIVPLVLVGIAVAWSLRPKPVLVETTEAARGPMRVTISGEGRTRVKDRYVVATPVYGNLARIELAAGDIVDEGTVLATLEPTASPLLDARQRHELAARAEATEAAGRQANSAVARAQTAARFAERELARLQALQQKGMLSRAELETAELSAETTAKELESAKFGARVAKHEHRMALAAVEQSDAAPPANGADLTTTQQLEIRSPVAGRVLRIARKSEGVVQPGEELLELADLRALEVVLDVLTTEAVQIHPGDSVDLVRWGGEAPLHGRVRTVEPAAFTKVSALGVEEQRVHVVIDIVEPPEDRARLGDGYAMDVDVVVWQGDDVLHVPLSALFRDRDGWAAYVVQDGEARVRRVEVGQRNDFEVEITGGVEPGEQVILHPGDRVHDGTLVAPEPTA